MRLVVVGGGIAGLAGARAARREAEAAGVPLDITLFESSDRLGGKIRTDFTDGAPLEWGPDSFVAAKPRGRDLAVELGLRRELVPPAPAARRTYLLDDGRMLPLPSGLVMGIPTGPGAILEAVRNGIVSGSGAARMAVEPLLPGRLDLRGPAARVARERLGTEGSRALVEPLVRGVFGTSAERIGARWAFPWARGRRSLVVAAAARPRPRGPLFLGIRAGMTRLVDALMESLDRVDVRTSCAVESIARSNGRFVVGTSEGQVPADAVLLAVPATAAAGQLEPVAPEAARHLAAIEYGASAVVLLRFAEASLGRALNGSGYLTALSELSERSVVAACSFVSAKWPHVTAAAGAWLRAFVIDPDALALPDEGLKHRAALDVGAAVRAHGGADDIRLTRWADALPVYGPGHERTIAAARAALPPGLALAGAYLDGVGIPDCARTGEAAARDVVRALAAAA
jgi:protoporphyrinogen/coproporphyrinogen III oxidase